MSISGNNNNQDFNNGCKQLEAEFRIDQEIFENDMSSMSDIYNNLTENAINGLRYFHKHFKFQIQKKQSDGISSLILEFLRNVELLIKFRRRMTQELLSKFGEVNMFFSQNIPYLFGDQIAANPKFDPSLLEEFNPFLPGIRKNETSSNLNTSGIDYKLINEDSSDKLIYKENLYLTPLIPNIKHGSIILEDSYRKKRTPYISMNELRVGITKPERLINRRITKIKKTMEQDYQKPIVWITGERNLLAKITESGALNYFEGLPGTESTIIESSRINELLIFFKSSHHVLFTDLNLGSVFEADIDCLFESQDQVSVSLCYDSKNLVIMGTVQGYLMLLQISTDDRTLAQKDRNCYAIKSFRSLIWSNYKNLEFAAISEEGRIVVIKINEELVFEPLRVFTYNSCITSACCFYKFALIGFEEGILSVIEFEKGSSLVSYKIPSNEEGHFPVITWAGFISSDSSKKSQYFLGEDQVTEEAFQDLLSKIKYMVRTDSDILYIFGHNSTKSKWQEFRLFDSSKERRSNKEILSQPSEPIFEKHVEGIALRFFKVISVQEPPKEHEEADPAIDQFNCLMCEVSISANTESQ